MSRLDDLIDLIQTTNEVYFITAPGRVRTAYILVDDIVELALKTFLQEKALEQREQFKTTLEQANLVTNRNHRNALDEYFEETISLNALCQRLNLGGNTVAQVEGQIQGYINALAPANFLQHWSANDPDNFRNHPEVVRDVKLFFPAGHVVLAMLDGAVDRHRVRNKFYHDHQHAGLTIDDDKCLRALCDMFGLLEQLFQDFHAKIQANKTVRCQLVHRGGNKHRVFDAENMSGCYRKPVEDFRKRVLGVLRLKLAAHGGANELIKPYYTALEQLKRGHQYDFDPRSVEHSLVHTVSERFFLALREQFRGTIGQLQFRVDEINRMSRPRAEHQGERADKQQLITILQTQLTDIESLM